MDQPLEANFFPSLLEGVAGRLGLVPSGVPNPSTLAKARVSRQWAATLREGIIKSAGRDTDLEQVAHNVLPPGLHLDYNLDFQTRRVDDIAPTLTPPLPKKHSSLKSEEGLWDCGWAPAKPDTPGPFCDDEMVPRMQMGEQGENNLDKTLPESDPEEVAAVVISDDDDADLPIDIP